MLFNSPVFLFLFLPLTLLFFWLAAKYRGGRSAHMVLTLASIVFYGYWDWRYLFLLGASTIANYLIGRRLSSAPEKLTLALGIGLNLSVLGYFKYTDFAIANLNALFGSDIGLLSIALPLGISFFTFQKIAYLVDCWRGRVTERDPLRFGLFVMFFPQLIAGPIVHHAQIIPQLKSHEKDPLPSSEFVAHGLFLLIAGLFKKVIIADSLARYVDPAFADPSMLNFMDAWTATLAYTLQLYFDFSAYSEMAMGLALLFGITLPKNFDSPYQSASITEFWRRWHISLGAFLREYLYIPLGGNRYGMRRLLLASYATMLLGGLWHGAAWTFVAWGAIHATYLAIHKIWSSTGFRLPHGLAVFITFIAVMFAWVPFRATSMSDALLIWETMLAIKPVVLPAGYASIPALHHLGLPFAHSIMINGLEIIGLFLLAIACVHMPNVHSLWNNARPNIRWGVGVMATSVAVAFSLSSPSTFMYFQF